MKRYLWIVCTLCLSLDFTARGQTLPMQTMSAF